MKARTSGLKTLLVLIALVAVTFAMGASSALATTTAPPTNDSPRYEAWLTKQVRHDLVTLPWYGVFDNLEYQVHGTEVVLSGQVVDPVTKSDAANTVKRLEGVTRVENNIHVLPLSPADNSIRIAEYRTIYSEPALSRYGLGAIPSIHIIVDNGHVTLEGAVDSATDSNIAALRANMVPGVFSVTNHLRVG
ncbi:MAG TPA: BON domain-containing protein [Terriglobia bacterium]|nr:BON domain-containing protein [Terriglobia bacterium]